MSSLDNANDIIPTRIKEKIDKLRGIGYSVDVNASSEVVCMVFTNASGFSGMYSVSSYSLDDVVIVDDIVAKLDELIGRGNTMITSSNSDGPFLPSINKKIEHLKMMGYSVDANISAGSFIVSFEANNYRATYEVSYNALFEDFIIETIVRQINETIRSVL